jgi:hypothetical protein
MTEEQSRAYAALEIAPGSPPAAIRLAYHDLVRVWHPDRHQQAEPRLRLKAEEKLKHITRAWELLRPLMEEQATGAPKPGADPIPLDFGDRWGYIDPRGRTVIHPEFVMARPFREGLAAVQVVDRWGFIAPDGEMRIAPLYQECGDFSEGLAAVKWYNRWGYIDSNGAFVVQPRFQEAGPFNGGRAEIKLGIRHGYVGRDGIAEFPANRLEQPPA